MEARELNGTHVGSQVRVDYGDPSKGDDLIRGRLESALHDHAGTTLEVATGAGLAGGGVITLRGAQDLKVEVTA